ncbi:hypothetical protein EDD37DRAFT_48096 [Exophiala viscosa]|uniref:uncharacterized protein n=1 Tax=Exophiala viscosa TaxID=2486360 RepID=UPI0021940A1A|nr:hypothetical protein EDD37DRAFT_48096 [Exophiala viscosa]
MMTGYGALASMMASHQDIEAFRKFSSMNAENILHMQAELQHLEMVINEIRKMPELNSFDRIWIECPEHMSEDDIRKIFERSRTLLDQYCKCLIQTTDRKTCADGGTDRTILQTAKVNALNPPPKDNLELRRRWYDEESGGDAFLHGVEAGIFCDRDIERDLMTIKEDIGRKDPLARFLSDRIVPLYHRMVGHRIHRSMAEKAFRQTWEYRSETLVQIANTFCMILSAVIPAFSILVLFSVQSIEGRLIAISAMSLVFSLVMNVIAQKRADVFMSTTGFAAVLVVFVGSANVMNG